jgi:hypothetical protein
LDTPRVTDWTGENPKWDREYPRWPSRLAVTERFGSWTAALEAVGMDPHVRRWSNAEILAALRELAARMRWQPRRAVVAASIAEQIPGASLCTSSGPGVAGLPSRFRQLG